MVFTDKIINRENAEYLRRMVMLTKVEQIIENEKIEAVNKAKEEARKDMERVIANLLRRGSDISMISECTGCSVQEVQNIQDNILQEA